ncbi:MAG: J domain-containing protein [Spirochaetota bacterium]
MELEKCYTILELTENATDDEISRSFRQLAFKYHPDRNPHRSEWANKIMSELNTAYTTIMTHRFEEGTVGGTEEETYHPADEEGLDSEYRDNVLTAAFIEIREKSKEVLYTYFQYGLYNIPRREQPANKSTFNRLVKILQTSYHALTKLSQHTADEEFLEHFDTYRHVLFSFYKSSECLNIIDSYTSNTDVQAFRLYKKGDESLHEAQREVFYDRHNRGWFKKEFAQVQILRAIDYLKNALRSFPRSSWAVETSIKLEHAQYLKKYIELFFEDD